MNLKLTFDFFCSLVNHGVKSDEQLIECRNTSGTRILFENIGTLYISYQNWNIFIIVNLEDWRTLLDNIQINLSSLQIFIKKRKISEFDSGVRLLESTISDIYRESMFLKKNERKKRQLLMEFGYFLATKFGLLTYKDGEKIVRNLQLLEQGVIKNIQLTQSHTALFKSIIDDSKKLSEKANRNINNLAESVKKVFVRNRMEVLKNGIKLFLWETKELLTEIQRRFKLIFDVIQYKKVNTLLIDLEQFKTLLKQISTKGNIIPFEIEKIEKYYSELDVSTEIYNDYISFKLIIPMKGNEKHDVFKYMSNPWESNGTIQDFILKNDVIVLSKSKNLIFKEIELTNTCKKYHKIFICNELNKNIDYEHEVLCVTECFKENYTKNILKSCRNLVKTYKWKQTLITKINDNSWKIIAKTQGNLNLVCPSSDELININQGENCVRIPIECIGYYNNIKLIPYNTMERTYIAETLPKFEISKWEQGDELDTAEDEIKIEEFEINEYIKELKEMEETERILNETFLISHLEEGLNVPWLTITLACLASLTSILSALILKKKNRSISIEINNKEIIDGKKNIETKI